MRDDRPHLFMDVDGVLNRHMKHPNGYCGTDPGCVARLNHVIRETDCKIVVSSAWRYLVLNWSMTVVGLENLFLTHGLDCYQRIAGVTRRDISATVTDRGEQIAEYVSDHGIIRYAVVDDGGFENDGATWTDLGISAADHPFVLTVGDVGLTDEDADRLIQLLGSKP